MCDDRAATSGGVASSVDGPGGGEAPDSPASLEHLETIDHALGVQTRHQWRLHGPFAESRRQVVEAFRADGGDDLQKRVERMRDCCSLPAAGLTETGVAVLRLNRCRDRMCPLCSQRRAWACAKKIERLTKEMDSPKFLTVTIRVEGESLRESLDKLASAFRGLRKTRLWRVAVAGGVYSIEVTRGADGTRWHPHLHAVIDAGYMPQKLLADAWRGLTAGSSIVDIRAVRSRRSIARYLSKYVAKGDAFGGWTEADIVEYARAMHGRRVMHTFGSMHGRTADETEGDDGPGISRCRVGVSVVEIASDAGVEAAGVVMRLAPRLSREWRLVLAAGGWVEKGAIPPLMPGERVALADAIRELSAVAGVPAVGWGDGRSPDGAEAVPARARHVEDERLFDVVRPGPAQWSL